MTIGPDPMSNIVLMSSRFGIETPRHKNFIIIDKKHLKSDYKYSGEVLYQENSASKEASFSAIAASVAVRSFALCGIYLLNIMRSVL